jgi:guanosine-3',5'-bis(diphosphate) 3'-pyrophosphohydrolase
MNKDNMSVFEQAINYATRVHAGMTRKGSGVPYIVHPIEAAAIVSTMTTDEEVLAAAVLHDVLEDTDTEPEELETLFGPRIRRLVEDETENKRLGMPASQTWRLRKEETIRFLREQASWEAKVLALGDKLSNMRAVYRDIQILGDALWERFNEKDKNMHAWMYSSVSEALSELSGYVVWQEYNWLIRETFGEAAINSKVMEVLHKEELAG